MKSIFKKALFLLAATFTFAACEDVPAPYDKPGEGGGNGDKPTTEVAEGDGTLANPYNAKGANEYIATLEVDVNSENAIYVKGIISSIKENSTSNYGNATFYISADGLTSSEQFYVYRALGLGNKKFTTDNALNVGDEVVICGKVVNYRGNTPETVQNQAYIYSLNGEGGNGDDPTQPSEPITGDNLLVNGDFETWVDGLPTNWKTSSTAGNATLTQSSDAHSGNYAVSVGFSETANKRLGYKELTLKAGTYQFSFYAKATTAESSQCQGGYVPVNNGTADSQGYKYFGYQSLNNSEWTLVSGTFTLDAQTTVCLLVMNPKTSNYATAQNILVDDVVLVTNDGGIVDGGTTPDTPNVDPSKPISAAEALAILAAMEPAAQTAEMYTVYGKVIEVTEISTQYGNATVVLEGGFTLFRFKDFGGANFTDENAIKVGDEISVKGYLKNYVKEDVVTPELVNGTLVELNGKTEGEGGNTGDDPVVNPGDEKTIVFIAGSDCGSISDYNLHGADTMTKNGVTISITDGCLGISTDYRTYKSASMTITSAVGNIASVEFTCTANGSAKQGPGNWEWSTGDYTFEEDGKVGTWSGDASSITFTATANQVRATKIVVTLK